MRTATITWIYYENFGTYLQAYALQKSIIDLGHENVIIDDSFFYRPSLKGRIKKVMIDIMKGKSFSHKAYQRFKRENLGVENFTGDTDEIKDKFDAYICGSDQIWSPYLEFNPYYYLGFTSRKKIAYAPSTGTGSCTEQYKQNVKPHIDKFSHVAVREEAGQKMLSSFIDKNIDVVLDPTLLLTKEQWDRVECKVNVDSPYILCYFLTPNQWYLDYVKEYAIKHNKHIKIFNTNPRYKSMGFETIEAGPGEFISYIKNADKVFTDSFHSSIFSILYHKDIITFKRFEDGGKKDQNARIANLFCKLGIPSYFIGREELDKVEELATPDYTKVEEKLAAYREASRTYLKNAIEN